MTASVTFSPRYASASVLSFCRIIALISGGVYDLSPMTTLIPSLLGSFSTLYGTSSIERFTSGSSQRRPMKRLIEKTVFAGLVTAWRLASWPTRRSPVLVKATTDGTVRPPSAELMTVGSPPSMTATTEFVVPRSMPMILPMVLGSPGQWLRWVVVKWSEMAQWIGPAPPASGSGSNETVGPSAGSSLESMSTGPPGASGPLATATRAGRRTRSRIR